MAHVVAPTKLPLIQCSIAYTWHWRAVKAISRSD